jgi:hypothetical protein
MSIIFTTISMKVMTKRLNDIFYNSTTGYSGLKELLNQAKEQKILLTNDEIKQWYQDQPINQIYKPFSQVKNFSSFKSHTNQTGELYADLMDVSRFSWHNKGVKYLLNIIDLFSRYAWSFPLKSKKPSEIEPYIKEVIESIPKNHIISFTFDKGREFMGEVKALLNSKHIQIYLNDPKSLNGKNKMALIERFHQTLWNMIKKYLSSQETLTYIDQLPQFIQNYNNRIHSTIQDKPINVFKMKQPVIVVSHEMIHPLQSENKFQIGDMVRVQKKRHVFDKKGLIPIYSKKIYKIISIKGKRYEVDDGSYYYAEQLVKGTEQSPTQSEYQKLIKQNAQQNKTERQLRKDFKAPLEQIQNQIIKGKRVRKPPSK